VKDRTHVLWLWDPVPGADAATFTVDRRGARDSRRCYREKAPTPCPAEPDGVDVE